MPFNVPWTRVFDYGTSMIGNAGNRNSKQRELVLVNEVSNGGRDLCQQGPRLRKSTGVPIGKSTLGCCISGLIIDELLPSDTRRTFDKFNLRCNIAGMGEGTGGGSRFHLINGL